MDPRLDLEAIRKRPGMYVGDVHDGSGLAQMLWELVANALDQCLAGRCTRVEVTLHREGGATLTDDGPGIEPEVLPRALGTLHDTATLDGHAPHVHLGDAFGLGMACVSALSDRFEIETRRGGRAHRWTLARGVPLGAIESAADHGPSGTRVRFLPDATIFASPHLPRELVYPRMRDLADLLAGVTFAVRDEGSEHTAPHGLVDRVRRRLWTTMPIVAADEVVEDSRVTFALSWNRSPWRARDIESFVNFGRTKGGGTHVTGLRRAVRSIGRNEKQRASLANGLVGCVAVLHRSVKYGSPTRDKLASEEVAPLVYGVVRRALVRHFEAHPDALAAVLSYRT